MNENEGSDARRSAGMLIVNGIFYALVLSASVLALSPLVSDGWPRLGNESQGRDDVLTASAGLAYQRGAVNFDGVRAESLGPLALAAIDYPWGSQLRGWTITFVDGEGHVAGYTWSQESRIEVFVRPGDDVAAVTRVLAHELGHAVDVSLNDADERNRWLAQRGAEAVNWWPTSGAADFETGAGDFAEVFAAWQVGDSDFRSRVARTPTPEDLALLEQLAFD